MEQSLRCEGYRIADDQTRSLENFDAHAQRRAHLRMDWRFLCLAVETLQKRLQFRLDLMGSLASLFGRSEPQVELG